MIDTLAALARPALLVALAALAVSAVGAPATKPGPVTVYVGTYTEPILFGTGQVLQGTGKGIYSFVFDPEAGTLTPHLVTENVRNWCGERSAASAQVIVESRPPLRYPPTGTSARRRRAC